MSRHFRLRSELPGAIAKRLPHAKNQLSAPGSFFNQFVTDIYIYIHIHINRVLIVRIGRTANSREQIGEARAGAGVETTHEREARAGAGAGAQNLRSLGNTE